MVRRNVLKRWVVEYLGSVAPGFTRSLNKLCIDIYRVVENAIIILNNKQCKINSYRC